MVYIDCATQVVARETDGWLTSTTPIPERPSQRDTAQIPFSSQPCNKLTKPTPLQPSYQGSASNTHLFQVRGSSIGMCGEIHTSKNHHMYSTHTHTATPATYLCYITHATAYPSTSRFALDSATDRDDLPEFVHCNSKKKKKTLHNISAMKSHFRHEDRSSGLLMLNDLCLSWQCKLRFQSDGLFPKCDIWQSMRASVAKGFVFKVDH